MLFLCFCLFAGTLFGFGRFGRGFGTVGFILGPCHVFGIVGPFDFRTAEIVGHIFIRHEFCGISSLNDLVLFIEFHNVKRTVPGSPADLPDTFDPFTLDEMKMRDRDAGPASSWHHARDVADISGGRRDEPRNEINWIRDAVVSVGTVDFGDGSFKTLEATFSAPMRSGLGSTSFYIDSLKNENKIAEFIFDQKQFLTESWRTFAPREQVVTRKITGKHRVFIKFEGSSFCNLQSWRMK